MHSHMSYAQTHHQWQIQTSRLGQEGGARGAEVERRRREDQGAKGAEGDGCGEGVSPSPLGVGSGEVVGRGLIFSIFY